MTDSNGFLPLDADHLWGWLWSAVGAGCLIGFLLIFYSTVLHRR